MTDTIHPTAQERNGCSDCGIDPFDGGGSEHLPAQKTGGRYKTRRQWGKVL